MTPLPTAHLRQLSEQVGFDLVGFARAEPIPPETLFGWLESGLGNGTPALAGELGYNVPQGPCQPTTGVTTKTGMDTSVLSAFNTRFDVYANGNTTCPNQGGGSCNPAVNTRKDLECPYTASTGCKNNSTWTPVTYDPDYDSVTGAPKVLPVTGAMDPPIMGYPHDLCQSGVKTKQTCGIKGSAVWDVNAYFRVNYHMDETAWRAAMGAPYTSTTQIPARYDVYLWEQSHTNQGGYGIGVRRNVTGGIAQQQGGKRRIVIDDDAAFAVKNLAPRGQDRNFTGRVFLGGGGIEIALHHLQPPQSVSENQKNDKNDVLHRGQALGGHFFIAAKHYLPSGALPPCGSAANVILSGEVT